jgi:uncharacterized protein YciI
MPTFIAYCVDKPNALELRKANRPEHLDYVKGAGEMVRLAGPFLTEAGDMAGSLLVLEAADLAAAQAFCAADPYAKAGVFERVEVQAWRVGIGQLP